MPKRKRKLINSELAAFCEQMSYMVNAGIPLQKALLLMDGDSQGGEGARITGALLCTLEDGGSFAQALRQEGSFPPYLCKMVEIGEASGRLDQVLGSLGGYYNRQEDMAKSVKSAVAYPLVMIAMMVAVILVIIVQVLPVFNDVFSQLGGEMSGVVVGLMQFGEAVGKYAAVIIAVVAALVVLFLLLRASSKGKELLSALYERVFKKTTAAVLSARFASAMSMMLGSGMDVDEALAMAAELQSGRRAKQKVEDIRANMAMGAGFAQAMVQSGVFSPMYGKMIAVGFKTGTLDRVMQKIA